MVTSDISIDNGNGRPVSFYENSPTDSKTTASNNNTNTDCDIQTPSQTRFLNTTVPQNIASHQIGGKHTPTRNSLRHSRMIVLNRSGQAITPRDIPFIRYGKFIRLLLIVIVFFGSILCFISLWCLLWSPNIRSRDNPYWSAVPILLSGILGLLFLRCFPKEYPGKIISYWIKSLKYISITVSTLAALTSLVIFFVALFHIVALTLTHCAPPSAANNTCVCKQQDNSTEATLITFDYHYVDFSCTEVTNILSVIVIFICAINAAVFICQLIYLYFHWASRNIFYYSRVPTNSREMRVFKTNR